MPKPFIHWHKCCQPFEKATRSGSDNEGWGALITPNQYVNPEYLAMGTVDVPITVCPWCGTPIEPPPKEIAP